MPTSVNDSFEKLHLWLDIKYKELSNFNSLSKVSSFKIRAFLEEFVTLAVEKKTQSLKGKLRQQMETLIKQDKLEKHQKAN